MFSPRSFIFLVRNETKSLGFLHDLFPVENATKSMVFTYNHFSCRKYNQNAFFPRSFLLYFVVDSSLLQYFGMYYYFTWSPKIDHFSKPKKTRSHVQFKIPILDQFSEIPKLDYLVSILVNHSVFQKSAFRYRPYSYIFYFEIRLSSIKSFDNVFKHDSVAHAQEPPYKFLDFCIIKLFLNQILIHLTISV